MSVGNARTMLRAVKESRRRGNFRDTLRKTLTEEMDAMQADPTGEVSESLYVKDTLPPSIFPDGKNMDPGYVKLLQKIANDFWESIDALPAGMEYEDAVVVGSAVSYNWSQYSDIDLHLSVDFSAVDENFDLVKDYFRYAKSSWNDSNSPEVGGFNVEVYVEDLSEENVTPGMYSIDQEKWLKFPEKPDVPDPDVGAILDKAIGIMEDIEAAERSYHSGTSDDALRQIEKLKEKIRQMRKSGLEKGGVFSVENLAFKVLRRNGALEKLSELKREIKNISLSAD